MAYGNVYVTILASDPGYESQVRPMGRQAGSGRTRCQKAGYFDRDQDRVEPGPNPLRTWQSVNYVPGTDRFRRADRTALPDRADSESLRPNSGPNRRRWPCGSRGCGGADRTGAELSESRSPSLSTISARSAFGQELPSAGIRP